MRGVKNSRLESDFSLLVSAVHDIKTPLAFIKNATDSIISGEIPDQYRLTHIKRVSITADRVLKIIDAMIGGARARNLSLELEPVNVADAIYQSRMDVIDYAKSIGIEIEVACSRNLPLAYAHRLGLRRVLFNLMDNAIRYSPSRQPVRVSARRENNQVRVSVRDRGVGINKNDYKKIFTMFGTGATPSPATPNSSGLGLYIASELSRSMGSKLKVVSSKRGSNFILRLPLAKQLSLF